MPVTSNASRVLTGARAKLGIMSGTTVNYVGIFSHCSYSMHYVVEPVYILGRYSPADTEYTSQDLARIDCTGWRVFEHGPHAEASVPKLQDLLTSEYLTLQLFDRLKGAMFAQFQFVRAVGYSTTVNARGIEEITINFVGILVQDESSPDNDESPNSMNLDTVH